MKKIRTRFAPSPTGKLHIGGARTALFCYLFAKHHNGEFILRIEDTDIERNIINGEKNLIDGLTWLNIKPDYYPGHENKELGKFRQTEKKNVYEKYANELLERNEAYKCYCDYDSSKTIDESNAPCGAIFFDKNGNAKRKERTCLNNQNQNKPYSIRIKMKPDCILFWNDGVRENVSFNSNDIGDWVLIKSNGLPTYNFANPIDDFDMKITHVMRGEEHISNTPKQIYINKLFSWENPHFTHFTVIIGEDGKKLSKRDEKVLQFIDLYEERGYVPEAVVNFLSLLGWSPKNEKEIFTKEELINLFELNGLNKSPSKFDINKLKWLNNQYIKLMSKEQIFDFLKPFTRESKLTKKIVEEIIELYQSGLKEGIEIKEYLNIFENQNISYTNEMRQIIESNKNLFKSFFNDLKGCEWKKENLFATINSVGEKLNLKGKNLMMPLRILLTGINIGPDIGKTIELLGKEKVLKLLEIYG